MSIPQQGKHSALAQAALTDILDRGAPILGSNEDLLSTTDHNMSDWMARFPDETKLVHMNLPGTHDTCTWNYSPETQESLKKYTGPIPDSKIYRCQEHSIFHMLNDGIRVFDLRYAYNPGLDTVGFYHSKALLSPTTRMEDAFFGFYSWLNLHPTEAVLISMNHEYGTGTPNDAALQKKIYDILTSPLVKIYWSPTRDELGTLGEARGKLTLLQRFDFDLLPNHLTERMGIHLDPTHWTVNGKSTELVYNHEKHLVAYIQDHYSLNPSPDNNPQSCVDEKYQVTIAHLENAADPAIHPDQLYISFASAAYRVEEPSLTPMVYALGDPTRNIVGVNLRLLEWLKERKGQRFGIVLLDFYRNVPGLIEALIRL